MYPGSSDNAKVSLAMGSLNGREKLHNIKKKGTGMDSNHTPNNKTNEFIVVPLREKKKLPRILRGVYLLLSSSSP